MSVRGLIAVLLLVGLAGLGWQQRDRLQAWAGSARLPDLPDVPALSRSEPPAAAVPGASQAFKPGELRKCVKGTQVSYANVDCPPGARALPVSGGAVTVVPATPLPKPSEAASGPSALHKALDVTRDDGLRDKIMQRQIEGGR